MTLILMRKGPCLPSREEAKRLVGRPAVLFDRVKSVWDKFIS